MSMRLVSWALYEVPGETIEPVSRLVLIALADHATGDGVAWPSVDRLGRITGLSRSTVQRRLRDLATAELICPAPPGSLPTNYVQLPPNRRPTAWVLGCQRDTPTKPGVSDRGGSGVSLLTPKPRTEPVIETYVGTSPHAPGRVAGADLEAQASVNAAGVARVRAALAAAKHREDDDGRPADPPAEPPADRAGHP